MLLSVHADSSTEAANRALAHFREQQTLASDAGRRMMSSFVRTSRLSFPTFSAQDAILRLVAIAEAFSFVRLVEVAEDELPEGEFARLLWEAELSRSADTWEQRNKLWNRYLRVPFSDFDDHEALSGFIDARNAISHGLGELTRKQLRSREKHAENLRKAGVALQQERLLIGASQAERCAAVVLGYIAWLDGKHSVGKGAV